VRDLSVNIIIFRPGFLPHPIPDSFDDRILSLSLLASKLGSVWSLTDKKESKAALTGSFGCSAENQNDGFILRFNKYRI